jgi:hypothetical protein
VREGPTLLAGTVIDDVFARRHPQVAASVHTEPWLQNALAVTGFHFVGFALCLAGAVLSILFYLPRRSSPNRVPDLPGALSYTGLTLFGLKRVRSTLFGKARKISA